MPVVLLVVVEDADARSQARIIDQLIIPMMSHSLQGVASHFNNSWPNWTLNAARQLLVLTHRSVLINERVALVFIQCRDRNISRIGEGIFDAFIMMMCCTTVLPQVATLKTNHSLPD